MNGALEIARTSAVSTRREARADAALAMLIDTTTCIGCKACEVACVEWNNLALEPCVGAQTLEPYQTLPDMTPQYWNLIRFNEIAVGPDRLPLPAATADGSGVQWLLRKDMCLHCAEPGCLLACPAEGAIVQYTNGIVDFQGEHCIGCGYCMTGCPFNIPKFDNATQRVSKCTMCSDRVANGLGPACVKACPTGCLEFGSKPAMLERAAHRAEQAVAEGFSRAGVYDPPGVGGTGVIYVLHHADRPELYGGLPRNPRVDPLLWLWKGPLKLAGTLLFGLSLAAAAIHHLRTGRQRVEARPEEASSGREILRYSVSDRVVHWTVALSFLYAMVSGLGLFTPGLSWLLVPLGGGQTARAGHPIAGCVFVAAVAVLLVKWIRDIRLTPDDRVWLRRLRDYLRGRDEDLPPSGRFNAGQKLLLWAQTALGCVLLASGIPVWFPALASRDVRLWSLVVHSGAAVLAVILLIAHVYMAVVVTPGSLRAMTEGKVTEAWARKHHRRWADEIKRS